MKQLFTILLAAFLFAANTTNVAQAMEENKTQVVQASGIGALESLPNELILYIFSFFSPTELFESKAFLVSKDFSAFFNYRFNDPYNIQSLAKKIIKKTLGKVHNINNSGKYAKALISGKSDLSKRKRLLWLLSQNVDPNGEDKNAILQSSADNLLICRIFFPYGSHVNSIIAYNDKLQQESCFYSRSLFDYLINDLEKNNQQSLSVLIYISTFRKEIDPELIDNTITNAIRRKKSLAAKHLIEQYKISANLDETFLSDLLQWAAYSEDLEIVKFTLEKGADVNYKDCDGGTALHEIAQSVSLGRGDNDSEKLEAQKFKAKDTVIAIAKLLIKHGAQVSLKDNDGFTPLAYAVEYSACNELKKLFLKHGANVKELLVLNEDS